VTAVLLESMVFESHERRELLQKVEKCVKSKVGKIIHKNIGVILTLLEGFKKS
jgi:hypothetical protein